MTTPTPDQIKRLGRLVEHDPRSRAFPARAVADIRDKVWRKHGRTLDQGTLGSCTGNAAAHAMNTNPYREYRTPLLTQEDAVSIYTDATILDPFPGTYPPEDTGSSGLAVAKVLRNRGYISGYSHAFSVEQALGALMLGPLLFGTWWHGSMFEPDARGYIRPDGNKYGGHEVLIVGYTGKTVHILNSWGNGFGQNGRAKLTLEDFTALMLDDGDVTALRPKTGA